MAARTWGGVLAAACAAVLAACTATTAGVAVKPPGGGDEAVVSLMDTGGYRTTPGPPPGNAGADRMAAAHAEAQRMAPFVVGPWQVDAGLVNLDFLASVPLDAPFNVATALSYPMLSDALPNQTGDVVAAHGFVAGLTTGRTGRGNVSRLQHAVLRFPDAGAAAAATRELSAIPAGDAIRPVSLAPVLTAEREPLSPWQPGACAEFASGAVHPDVAASAGLGERFIVRSFTAHGPYVLYQFAVGRTLSTACVAIVELLASQESRLDQFVPTELAKMADLPVDPSGQLSARTLSGPSGRTPFSGGMWEPSGWLHFEPADPTKAQVLFASAGVDWISQVLTRVYQARDPAGAGQLTDRLLSDTRALPDVAPTASGVPGLPAAKCFNRSGWQQFHSDVMVANSSVYWHFSCIAQTGRYAFTAYSDQEQDVKQQISAQYRILAGQ